MTNGRTSIRLGNAPSLSGRMTSHSNFSGAADEEAIVLANVRPDDLVRMRLRWITLEECRRRDMLRGKEPGGRRMWGSGV